MRIISPSRIKPNAFWIQKQVNVSDEQKKECSLEFKEQTIKCILTDSFTIKEEIESSELYRLIRELQKKPPAFYMQKDDCETFSIVILICLIRESWLNIIILFYLIQDS